ncbi:DUF5937 family protein [Spirillospora sp. NPDC052269]
MYEFRLGVQDLAETSFGMSPLFESVFSLRPRIFPARHPEHQPWARETAAAYARLDTAVLNALYAPYGWLPDFLTPRPDGIVTDLESGLAVLRATPPDIVRRDIATTYRHGVDAAYRQVPIPSVLSGDPSAVLARICAAIESYWEACIEPYWARMRAVLEADLAYRARRLALGGAAALFAELDDRVTWAPGRVRVAIPSDTVRNVVVDVAGRGLVLVPCLFLQGAINMTSEHDPPVIAYPARGRGAVWDQAAPEGAAALAELLGAPRARLLIMLASPASTTELARRLGVTPGGVSRHLTALHACGLLNRTRAGRSVLYMRSPLGDQLVR